ncbi:hypothetical protein CAC42_2706 [Sphaceloma murrayae]|uniref:Uncharacterized protein n=1 Tax=Sphaceloma murrayae TaxID=2082308 RepID=A0A2K1R0E8_9PEZI|nr:hypothetical protein CAC42_2706 [Sphaceloma murrayae]
MFLVDDFPYIRTVPISFNRSLAWQLIGYRGSAVWASDPQRGLRGYFWRIEMYPMPYSSRNDMTRERQTFHRPLTGTFPGDYAYPNFEENFYWRSWSDGRMASGRYITDRNGNEFFIFGIVWTTPLISHQADIVEGRVQNEFAGVQFRKWFAATGWGGGGRAAFVVAIFEKIGREMHWWNGARAEPQLTRDGHELIV